jgi:hypothetical protein
MKLVQRCKDYPDIMVYRLSGTKGKGKGMNRIEIETAISGLVELGYLIIMSEIDTRRETVIPLDCVSMADIASRNETQIPEWRYDEWLDYYKWEIESRERAIKSKYDRIMRNTERMTKNAYAITRARPLTEPERMSRGILHI